MKYVSATLSLLLVTLLSTAIFAQNVDPADSTGLDGDHFSLEGALEIFKESKDLEDFEKKLNSENNNVNNLDLNGDGEVDYIRVIDNMDGDVHAIVLQVPVSKSEAQDIAVIEIELTGKENAILQIIGDEDVYGEQVIVEPYAEEAQSDGKGGPNADFTIARIVINVYFWKPVRWIYRPGYTVYVSRWHWGFWPTWWHPWRPRPWRHFHVHHVHHHRHYHVVSTHRLVRAHKVYTPRRKSSTVVRTRTTTRVASGKVTTKAARARTTTAVAAKGPGGNVVAGKKTTTTKAVKTKDGVAVGQKTTRTKAGKTKDG